MLHFPSAIPWLRCFWSASPLCTAAPVIAGVPGPARVRGPLLDYLEARLGVCRLRCAEGPTEIPHGWETYIYRFRLAGRESLPRPFVQPLILRIYASPQGVPRARHEFAVQRHLRRRGQPVAAPLLLEEDCRCFGGPFLLMELLPGATLLDHLRRYKTHIFTVADQLAEMHLRLHALPPAGFPAPQGGSLARGLDEVRRLIREHGLYGLSAGLDWLCRRRPQPPATPCIIHLDYHPMNVLIAEGRPPAVLDWTEADLGDRHADVATTLLLMRTTPVDNHALQDRLLAPLARWVLLQRYLHTYHRQAPLDQEKLRYYLAWAALRRLAVYGMWLQAGPEANGCKPAALHHVRTGHVDTLRRCFQRWAGVEVTLP